METEWERSGAHRVGTGLYWRAGEEDCRGPRYTQTPLAASGQHGPLAFAASAPEGGVRGSSCHVATSRQATSQHLTSHHITAGHFTTPQQSFPNNASLHITTEHKVAEIRRALAFGNPPSRRAPGPRDGVPSSLRHRGSLEVQDGILLSAYSGTLLTDECEHARPLLLVCFLSRAPMQNE